MREHPNPDLKSAREKLAADAEAFLKRGGKIKFIPSGIRTDAPTFSYNGPTTCKN
jgi:hypothetical protein